MIFQFGPYLADAPIYQVRAGDRVLTLTPKLLDLLFYFLERPETLITKETLLDGVWPGANVTDNALAQAISDLRDALGDSAASPTYIRTVSRRGYRFVAPVAARASSSPGRSAPGASPPDPQPRPAFDRSRAIAVLDFANVTGNRDVSWLAAGIAETVTSDLAALGHFHVIDRWRVVQAERRNAGQPLHELGAAIGAALLVTGSFQRQGPHLRITARLIDLDRGEALADAKVDGRLDDVFALQDDVVSAFARELGVSDTRPSARVGVRETSSLTAYRAYIEGWLKIESLDTDLVAASIEDFRGALAADPSYAMAYTGLANAEFVAFEMTRANRQPLTTSLTDGIEHARKAIALDPRLPEAHATLSFLLASALAFDEARASAEEAVRLAPEDWRHQYRLGHASWGSARMRALERALVFYPDFAYAHFETAMVFVARGQLGAAAAIAKNGLGGQDRDARAVNRFPAIGFHWLAGALALADDRPEAARDHFSREIAQVDRRRLYGPEYGAAALVGRGHAELILHDPVNALGSFRAAHAHVADYARAMLGEVLALQALGDARPAAQARTALDVGLATLDATGRGHEARIIRAGAAAARGQAGDALRALDPLFDEQASVVRWALPIEPGLTALRQLPEFRGMLARLAARAA